MHCLECLREKRWWKRVMIAIQNVKTDVDSFVVPDEYTRHLVIIRQDFRLQYHVVMIKRGNRLIRGRISDSAT